MKPNLRSALRNRRSIEALEARLAPAVLIAASGHSATYTDVDGDKVTVAVSSGSLTAGLFTTFEVTPEHNQLQKIDLSGGGFDGANLTVSVTRLPGGDGLVNVGFIDATGVDLGRVTVKGDLGRIVAGDPAPATPGLKSLTVHSMGTLGLLTQGGVGLSASFITGKLGALKVTTDFANAFLSVNGGIDARIDSISIGGDLVGGEAIQSGSISAQGDITMAKITGDVIGGSGGVSGRINTFATLHALTVSGSVIGGTGSNSGNISASVLLEKVTIGHDLVGGSRANSGFIQSSGAIASLTIRRNLIGGAGSNSGSISAVVSLSNGAIKGNVIGGSGAQSGRLNSPTAIGTVTIAGDLVGGSASRAGSIDSGGSTAAVTIGGSMRGGTGQKSGSILTTGTLGKVIVAHTVFGGSTSDSGAISSDVSISTAQIGGDIAGGRINSLGTIGDVRVKGSLIGSSASESGLIVSGGDMGNVRIDGDVIGGSIAGTASAQNTGAIESRGRIASVSLGGTLIAGCKTTTFSLLNSGAIVADDDLGPVKIAGSILGNSTRTAVISGGGQHVKPLTGFDVAVASVTVGRNVEYGQILAGVDIGQDSINADASVGTIVVNGHWTASDIAAGIQNPGSNGYGANNTLGFTGDTMLIARIASVTVKGYVTGSSASGDNFGFVAQQIDFLKIGPNVLGLNAGPSNDFVALPFANDVHAVEV